VKTSYHAWPEARKQAQINHVRELLDERRIQDLSFEPLILRLPRLDRLLPNREVAEAVVGVILSKGPRKEKALENLARAAKRLESWTPNDTETVVRSSLPPRVKSVLLS
jgi:hypothetical protein